MRSPDLFSMKNILALSVCLLFLLSCTAQQQRFDILTYSAPKGWTTDKKSATITFTKDGGAKGFCIITFYKSVAASARSKQNFDLSWESLVKNKVAVNAPAMQPVVTENGWETQVGSSVFEREGISGTCILMSSTSSGKLVNMLILLNGNEYISEMQSFLETVVMNGPEQSQAAGTDNTVPASTAVSNMTTPKHEVWMSYQYNMLKKRYAAAFLLKYANGDCLDYVPEQGVLGFSKMNDNRTDRHWGIEKDLGNQVHIIYSGYARKLGKVSAGKMSYPPGSTSSFYFKCVPVDGLKLEGEWSSGGSYGNPNWYKDPNYKEGTISFYKDGRFENNGGFYSVKEGASGVVYKDRGNGTYFIKDFTLVLTYSDGQVFTSALTGLKDVNPFKNNEILFFREVPFFKNLNR